jgi:hypothetical protein
MIQTYIGKERVKGFDNISTLQNFPFRGLSNKKKTQEL